MSAPSPTQPKRLHEMNRLEDMGRFPVIVYMGATANVLVEVLFFYWLHGRVGGRFSLGFVAAVILVACNLLPVVFLRWREGAAGLENTPPIEQMGFVRDQYRFASWVYAVASGNLFFWPMPAWAAFGVERSERMLLAVEGVALVCTFAPALARMARRTPPIGRMYRLADDGCRALKSATPPTPSPGWTRIKRVSFQMIPLTDTKRCPFSPNPVCTP